MEVLLEQALDDLVCDKAFSGAIDAGHTGQYASSGVCFNAAVQNLKHGEIDIRLHYRHAVNKP